MLCYFSEQLLRHDLTSYPDYDLDLGFGNINIICDKFLIMLYLSVKFDIHLGSFQVIADTCFHI